MERTYEVIVRMFPTSKDMLGDLTRNVESFEEAARIWKTYTERGYKVDVFLCERTRIAMEGSK